MTPGHHQSHSFHDNSLQHLSNTTASYTYQGQATSASSYRTMNPTSYSTTNHEGYGSSTYGNQQYDAYLQNASPERSADQTAASAQNHLKRSSYTQQDSTSTSHSNNHTANTYSPPSWGNLTYGTNAYNQNNNQVPDRSQSTLATPSYPSQVSTTSTLGRSIPAGSSHGNSTTYTAQSFRPAYSTVPSSTNQTYHTSYAQPTQASQRPATQRYDSPSHVPHAQQQHQQQGSHLQNSVVPSKHIPSPQMTSNHQHQSARQNSASAEPQPMTVNPSQVYDARAEHQRKALIEADRRRRRDEEAAKRRAEEDRIAEGNRKIEAARAEEESRKAEEEDRRAREAATVRERERAEKEAADQIRLEQEAAAGKAEEAAANRKLKAEQRKKANEEKKQSQTAASALQQMATGSTETSMKSGPSTQTESTSEEAQMRAMFARMREFNAKNPNMLAKLWEEERQFANSQSPQPNPASPVPTASAAKAPHPQPQPTPELGVAYSTPTLPPPVRPFRSPAASVAQSLPAKASSTRQSTQPRFQVATPLWPKQKRPAISEVAVKWLMSLPENASEVFRPVDILKILDGNPSYPQLCVGLQNLGAKFDQSSLARAILRGVPDLVPPKTLGPDAARIVPGQHSWQHDTGTSSEDKFPGHPAAGATSSSTSQVDRLTVNYDTPRFAFDHPASNANADETPTSGAMVVHKDGTAASQTRPSSSQRPNSAFGPVLPLQSQIIDESKTKHVSPEPIRPPANKEEAARKRKITDLVDLTASDSDDEGPPSKMVMLQSGAGSTASFQDPAAIRGPSVVNFALTPASKAQKFMGRGMLIPPQIGSNMHAAASKSDMRNQPMRAPLPPPKFKGPTPEQLQQERMKGKMLVEPIMRDRVARKSKYDSRTIARDVLLATGRHPDMRPLNQHLVIMSKLLIDHGAQQEMDGTRGLRSDLATIRWDIIDPGTPATVGIAPKPPTAVKDHVDSRDGTTNLHTDSFTQAKTPTHDPTTQRPATVAAATSSDRPKGKPGRPRKADKDKALGAIAGQAASTSTPARQSPVVVPTTELNNTTNSASPSAMSSTGGAVGYAAFRKYDEHGNLIKTKGRPKGWKKSLHSREVLGLEFGLSSGSKKTKPSMTKHLTESHPRIYKCEWRGCPAELHNLETLKKHVVKLHDEEDDAGQYACQWKGCSIEALLPDFQSWTEHIYQAHMNPVAWKLGDGPRGGISDFDLAHAETYLSDAHGRSVTPVIDPDVSSVGKQQHVAATDLQVLIDHKRIVGPSFEKTGCTLANAKRRRGFLDDEDYEHHFEEEDGRF